MEFFKPFSNWVVDVFLYIVVVLYLFIMGEGTELQL